MPKIKSAKKALKKSKKRYLRNLQRKRKFKNLEKNFKKAILEKNEENSKKYLALLYKYCDKLQKVGFLKKNTASRKKSRLTFLFNRTFKPSNS
ncbi:30S ribosomal protein S20 [bacterium]|nr:30S ribosomal protein S20 [bacterium]